MSSANCTLMIQIRSVTDAGNVKYKTRTATPEEIKAAHGKCGTCSYYGLLHTEPWNECLNLESPYFARHDGMIDKDKDYCRFYEDYNRNHHQPKET